MKTKIPSISFDLTLRKTDNKKLSTKFSILGLLVSFWCWCLFSPILNDVGGGVCSFSWTKSRSLPTKNSKRWRHQHQRSRSKRRSGKIRELQQTHPQWKSMPWQVESESTCVFLKFPPSSLILRVVCVCVRWMLCMSFLSWCPPSRGASDDDGQWWRFGGASRRFHGNCLALSPLEHLCEWVWVCVRAHRENNVLPPVTWIYVAFLVLVMWPTTMTSSHRRRNLRAFARVCVCVCDGGGGDCLSLSLWYGVVWHKCHHRSVSSRVRHGRLCRHFNDDGGGFVVRTTTSAISKRHLKRTDGCWCCCCYCYAFRFCWMSRFCGCWNVQRGGKYDPKPAQLYSHTLSSVSLKLE